MTRTERLAVAIVLGLLIALVLSIVLGAADRLNRVGWFGGAANEIQWSSAVATFAGIAAGFLWYNRTCAARPWCLRLGEHPVDGTLKKVCDHHHTLEHHRAVHATHAAAHAASGRLDRGRSHHTVA